MGTITATITGSVSAFFTRLGAQIGPDATENDIKKAYRKLALVKHPDKNKDNPNAADEFALLNKAYELLSDKAARAAVDAVIHARRKREEELARQGAKRRKLREDLELRERAAAAGAGARGPGASKAATEEEIAKERLRKELERLSRTAAERKRAAWVAVKGAGTSAPSGAASEGTVPSRPASTAETGPSTQKPVQEGALREQLARTAKVSWRESGMGNGYGADSLREIFSRHGRVEDVVIRDSGRKKKGTPTSLLIKNASSPS